MAGNMTHGDTSALNSFFRACRSSPPVEGLRDSYLQLKTQEITADPVDGLLRLYDAAIPLLESEIRNSDLNESLLGLYQRLFREMEQHIQRRGNDQRYEFIVVIPVADRPQHLVCCLDSLLHLCQVFGYGGYRDGHYAGVSALIADDSREEENIARNREVAELFTRKGLRTEYFGLDEQQEQLQVLTPIERKRIKRIVGEFSPSAFFHKGASIMRNITYLKLRGLAGNKRRPLFYFVDSDQEFKVRVPGGAGDRDLYAVNYFHYLDRIFSTSGTAVLTGKVVGDPPVSPAVMAGNLLEDVIGFLERVAKADPEGPCQFHGERKPGPDDASYHDMADLFGFRPAATSFDFQCTLRGEHDHAQCFGHFAGKLGSFFHGDHPTRKTYYQTAEPASRITDARTVYTGNYILEPGALKYFIPFASLKLRMAGPVLGRIIKAEIDSKFVSANLPMLHKRTVEETGRSEFRPGIEHDLDKIDLSGEFERQYFGDVMLFSMEELVAQGFPAEVISKDMVMDVVGETEARMLEIYLKKREVIAARLNQLKMIVEDRDSWWNRMPGGEEAKEAFVLFAGNIEYNFSESARGYQLICSEDNKRRRLSDITDAIYEYAQDRIAWEAVLTRNG